MSARGRIKGLKPFMNPLLFLHAHQIEEHQDGFIIVFRDDQRVEIARIRML